MSAGRHLQPAVPPCHCVEKGQPVSSEVGVLHLSDCEWLTWFEAGSGPYNGDPETIPVENWDAWPKDNPGPQRPTYRTGFTVYVTHSGDTIVNTQPTDIEMEPSVDDIRKASWDCWSFHDTQRIAEAVAQRLAR